MHTLHVVKEVVATRKAVTRHGSLTLPEVAKVWPGAVAVHTMRLPLMAEKARSRRELHADASLLVATERLEVRINVFAIIKSVDMRVCVKRDDLLVVALESGGLVAAPCLALLGAVVLAVLVWALLVERVAASDLGALFF